MILPTNTVSATYVEATLTDPLGVVTTISSQTNKNTTGPGSCIRVALPTGSSTISIPSGAKGVIITCGALCNSNKTLKGVAADTGILIFTVIANTPYHTGSMMLIFGSGATSFVITCAGGTNPDSDFTEFFFF